MKSAWVWAAVLLVCTGAQAELCARWSEGREVGSLDTKAVPEASGLVVSSRFKGRLYHVNDHGNLPEVYVTDTKGKIEQTIAVGGLGEGFDTEDLGYGRCGKATCIFVGDIGDNKRVRDTIQLLWFEEQETYKAAPKLVGQLTLTYPDGKHNSEGFVVHPRGDVFFFTKENDRDPVRPSRVYRLPAAVVAKGIGKFELEAYGEIDVPLLLRDLEKKEQLVTGAAISPDGTRVVLLTYKAGLEILWDFKEKLKATKEWKASVDYNRLTLDKLQHQEAVAFLPDGKGLLLTTELKKEKSAPILQVGCAD